jgi:hypothetical protein
MRNMFDDLEKVLLFYGALILVAGVFLGWLIFG